MITVHFTEDYDWNPPDDLLTTWAFYAGSKHELDDHIAQAAIAAGKAINLDGAIPSPLGSEAPHELPSPAVSPSEVV